MRIVSFCLAAAALAATTAASAGAVEDAQHHIRAVASGKIDNIMAAYSNNAHFEWVGGPLDGTYIGTNQIRGVWMKFAHAVAPVDAKIANLEQNGNPAGTTVTANVEFRAKKPIKVRYVLQYRHGKLVDEIWQIDPNLEVARY
jgi:hypothetical protein